MKLQHQTEVGAKPEDVWAFLQDTRAVVQCMPGAELVDELGDDRYEGLLRVAIGPLKMNYAGKASVVERNTEAHRMVIDASGRDKRGSGAVTGARTAPGGGRRLGQPDRRRHRCRSHRPHRFAGAGDPRRLQRDVRRVRRRARQPHREPRPGEPLLAASPPTAGQNHESGAATADHDDRSGAAATPRRPRARRMRSRSSHSSGRSPGNASPTSWSV